MKKIMILLAVVGLLVFSGCSNNDDNEDFDTIATTYENNNPYDFVASNNPNNNFRARFTFPTPIYDSDMVLVYRLGGKDSNNRDVWEFLPETYYFDNDIRSFTFNYNFTNFYVDVYLEGNDLSDVSESFRFDQIFRFVVVPANLVIAVDKNNYLEVMKVAELNEDQIQKIEINK